MSQPNYGCHETPQSKQDVVSVDIIPDEFPELSAIVQPQTLLNLATRIKLVAKCFRWNPNPAEAFLCLPTEI